MAAIRNPLEWGWDQLRFAAGAMDALGRTWDHAEERERAVSGPLPVRRVGTEQFGEIFRRAAADFGAYRTDVIFLCVIYPAVGILVARFLFGYQLLPMLFPVASGFALVGPFAAISLYEMSRLRERGEKVSWLNAFAVLRAPNLGAVVGLGLILVALFLVWIATAYGIQTATLGPEPPRSVGAFLDAVFTTPAGWAMIAIGIAVGFLFAVFAMAISVISFPLLIDRDVGLGTAIRTSVNAVLTNPGTMAAWGLVVAGLLVLGSLPLFLGLIVVIPLLGHATWHLYRAVIAPQRQQQTDPAGMGIRAAPGAASGASPGISPGVSPGAVL